MQIVKTLSPTLEENQPAILYTIFPRFLEGAALASRTMFSWM